MSGNGFARNLDPRSLLRFCGYCFSDMGQFSDPKIAVDPTTELLSWKSFPIQEYEYRSKAQAVVKRALRRNEHRPSSSTTRKAIIVGWITCFLAGACVPDKATSDDPPPIPNVRVDTIHSAEQRFSIVGSISRSAQAALSTIDFTNTAATQLNTINTVYFQPFNVFNQVINQLANVRFPDFAVFNNPHLSWSYSKLRGIIVFGRDCEGLELASSSGAPALLLSPQLGDRGIGLGRRSRHKEKF